MTGMPTTMPRNTKRLKEFALPRSLLMSQPATRKETTKPPVGPTSLPRPAVPPTKTGTPTAPRIIQASRTRKASCGFRMKATRLTTMVRAVTMAGVNGSGNEI